MGIERDDRGETVILSPQGPMLNYENYLELRQAFEDMAESTAKFVILDMGQVEYIDSVGLGSIISGRLRLRGRADIYLCALRPKVESVIHFARMDLIFSISESLDAALKAVSGTGAKPPV